MYVHGIDRVGTYFEMVRQERCEPIHLLELSSLRCVQPMPHKAGVLDSHEPQLHSFGREKLDQDRPALPSDYLYFAVEPLHLSEPGVEGENSSAKHLS